MSNPFDYDTLRVGMDNKRLTALLAAVLDAAGPVTLTQEQAEREWGVVALKSEPTPDGGVTLSIVPAPH
jgi:hypothetical protein